VGAPNTAFKDDHRSPIGRWRTDFSQEELATLERLAGRTLEQLGYELSTRPSRRWNLARMRAAYRLYFESKQILKTRTPAAKWLVSRNLARL
jgi:hypothetical protein